MTYDISKMGMAVTSDDYYKAVATPFFVNDGQQANSIEDENYVQVEIPRIPVANESGMEALVPIEKQEVLEFTDGFSNPVKSVIKDINGTGLHLTSRTYYDEVGRVTQSELPRLAADFTIDETMDTYNDLFKDNHACEVYHHDELLATNSRSCTGPGSTWQDNDN